MLERRGCIAAGRVADGCRTITGQLAHHAEPPVASRTKGSSNVNHIVRRPSPSPPGERSILGCSHFQVAYVTTDIEHARKVFSERYGIGAYQALEGPTPSGGYIRVALAWCGGLMYELVQTEGPGSEFYTERLPKEGFAIRHHHLGYFVETPEAWRRLKAKVAAEDWPIAADLHVQGQLSALYIEAPELGHYLEFIFPERGGVEFFESVPVT